MLNEVDFPNSRALQFSALIRSQPYGFFFKLRTLKENRLETDYMVMSDSLPRSVYFPVINCNEWSLYQHHHERNIYHINEKKNTHTRM